MKKIILTMALVLAASYAQAGWYYWDHGRLMWANKWGYVEDVAQVEAETKAELDQEALQEKLDELSDKLDMIQANQESDRP
jgi:mannose-1-phosphate guanylyltransferase